MTAEPDPTAVAGTGRSRSRQTGQPGLGRGVAD